MRNFLLWLIFYLGFFRLWLLIRPKSVAILMLHGVMDTEDASAKWQPFRSYFTRRDLDRSLALLRRYYRFISMDDALKKLEGEAPIDQHYCVVTFDDGLKNNLTHALPILRRHNIPAVFYLATQQVEQQVPFWFDRLDYAIQYSAHLVNSVDVFGKTIKLRHGNTSEMKSTFLAIKEAAYGSNCYYDQVIGELHRIILELEHQSGKSLCDIYTDDPWSKVMSWEDVGNSASGSDITFGSHTVDHSLLGKLSDEEIEYQLKHSKEEVEKHTKKPCLHFCYPNGDTSPSAEKYLTSAGFLTAVTTECGTNRKNDFQRFNLKRYHMPPGPNPIRALAVISGLRSIF